MLSYRRQPRRSLLIVPSEAELPRPVRVAPPALLAMIAPGAGMVLVGFLGGGVKSRGVFPVAPAVPLPGAVATLIDGITALRQASLPAGPTTLTPRSLSAVLAAFGHPVSGAALKLGNALDFF